MDASSKIAVATASAVRMPAQIATHSCRHLRRLAGAPRAAVEDCWLTSGAGWLSQRGGPSHHGMPYVAVLATTMAVMSRVATVMPL